LVNWSGQSTTGDDATPAQPDMNAKKAPLDMPQMAQTRREPPESTTQLLSARRGFRPADPGRKTSPSF